MRNAWSGLMGALLISSACADTTQLEAEVSDLKRRVSQLEKASGRAKAGKGAKGKAAKGKAAKGKTTKGKTGKGKAKAPAAPKVVVELTGDATKVSLHNGKRGFSVPGAVPAGEYTVQAAFAGDATLADVGSITLEPGGTTVLACSAETRTCAKQ